jgi:hypothetical protein
MSATITSRSYRIGKGLRCAFTYRPAAAAIDCHWDPGAPAELRGKALRAYRSARLEFVASIANRGDSDAVVVVDTFDLTASQIADLALAIAPVGGTA